MVPTRCEPGPSFSFLYIFRNSNLGKPLEKIVEVKLEPTSALLRKRTKELARKNRTAFFLHRDIPTDWVYRLFKCSRIAIVLGMLIRYWSVLERSDTISVTSMKLKDSQISKNQKAKALRELEDSGVILVERVPGKNPIVQIQGEHRHDGNYSKLSNRTPTR